MRFKSVLQTTFVKLFFLVSFLGLIHSRTLHAVENPLFAYSHMAPSPFTLPSGKLVLGTDVALGVTDFFQVGTSILRLAYSVYNANAKLSVYDAYEVAFAFTFEWENYNLRDFSTQNPNLEITSFQPGAVTSFALGPQLAWFLTGALNFTQASIPDTAESSGFAHGAEFGTDLSWAYNPTKKKMGNVLSAGVTYDFTYELLGFGISHHWPGFHVGVHYYPTATTHKLYPIVAGGAVVDL